MLHDDRVLVRHHCTVEPLTNDHPHQRPSLSYDHILCDDSAFCLYTNPSRATIPLIRPHQCDSEGGRIRGVLLYSQLTKPKVLVVQHLILYYNMHHKDFYAKFTINMWNLFHYRTSEVPREIPRNSMFLPSPSPYRSAGPGLRGVGHEQRLLHALTEDEDTRPDGAPLQRDPACIAQAKEASRETRANRRATTDSREEPIPPGGASVASAVVARSRLALRGERHHESDHRVAAPTGKDRSLFHCVFGGFDVNDVINFALGCSVY